MARITRKAYKRKKVVFGLCMFAAVALISTGFASWILSANATADANGKFAVSEVSDASVEFGKFECSLDEFRFGAREDDLDGRLYYNSSKPEEKENLTAVVSGYVKNADFLKCITVKLDVSDYVKQAATDEYIVLPQCVDSAIEIGSDELGTIGNVIEITEENVSNYTNVQVGNKIREFSYKVELKWGNFFGEQNPGDWYDNDAHEKGGEKIYNQETGLYEYVIDKVQLLQEMATFKALVENEADFKITVTAVSNGGQTNN